MHSVLQIMPVHLLNFAAVARLIATNCYTLNRQSSIAATRFIVARAERFSVSDAPALRRQRFLQRATLLATCPREDHQNNQRRQGHE